MMRCLYVCMFTDEVLVCMYVSRNVVYLCAYVVVCMHVSPLFEGNRANGWVQETVFGKKLNTWFEWIKTNDEVLVCISICICMCVYEYVCVCITIV
jgi:hypothetical protein